MKVVAQVAELWLAFPGCPGERLTAHVVEDLAGTLGVRYEFEPVGAEKPVHVDQATAHELLALHKLAT